jgi:hypothetical protein
VHDATRTVAETGSARAARPLPANTVATSATLKSTSLQHTLPNPLAACHTRTREITGDRRDFCKIRRAMFMQAASGDGGP